MVVLVTGASGQLGQAIQHIAKDYPTIQFVFCNSKEIDITNLDLINEVFNKIKPNYCINAAAYTAVDKSENEPEKAYLINAVGTKNIAEACKEHNTILLHISTDFVFDGTKQTPYIETDVTNPLGIYGKTKLQGEQAIQNTWEKHYIIRTSWVYSQFGNNFYKTMLRLAQERDEISVVNDQVGCPTYAVDLAQFLVRIIENHKPQATSFGIYHFSGDEVMSWYDFALKIFKENHIAIKVNPIPTSAYPTPAKRPAYSVLRKREI